MTYTIIYIEVDILPLPITSYIVVINNKYNSHCLFDKKIFFFFFEDVFDKRLRDTNLIYKAKV